MIVLLASIASGCGSKPTDPRTVIPADALVYLESADLGKTVGAMTNNPKFAALAKQKPDLSVLSGVKIGIAVTGFEAWEEPVTEENAVIDLQPRFVAVIETNAWGWQAKSFVENNVGEFFNNLLGGAVDLEITTRKDSEYYVWTSPEGRKAYALQQGSLVYFGNDESAIERCQAVKRGETDSFAKMGKVPDAERIAFGYVSPEGVGQIGNIVSILLAKSTGEEADVQSFVAQVLPEILRNTVREVTWSASESEGRIEDKLTFKLDDESSRVFNETMAPANSAATGLEGYLPDSAASVTRYLSRDPQVAWRSVVLTAQKKADATSGVLIGAFSGSLFEQYGIEDPEAFLTSVAPRLLTVRLSEDPDQVAVIATAKNLLTVNGAIAKEVPLTAPPEKQFGADLWKSGDGEFAAAFIGDVVVVGETNTVIKCLEAKQTQAGNPTQTYSQRELLSSDAVATTVGSENSKLRLVDALAERKNPNDIVGLEYKIETRFNLNGIERRTVSDFGLIGSIIEGLLPE
ncbi:MAG TPA: hypothetical protein VNA22_04495 [Pyrinomonadaceae bacterium]|nr:hypothetical protein [Pyrinomonadaceae bacterium]